jgi:hypothetical protein
LVGFAWLTVWAFLRIGTNPRVFEHPLSVAEAGAAVSTWLDQPVARIVGPAADRRRTRGPGHRARRHAAHD